MLGCCFKFRCICVNFKRKLTDFKWWWLCLCSRTPGVAGCVSSVITVERCLRGGVALPVVTTWDNNPTQSTSDWTNTTRSIFCRPAHDRSQSKFLDFTFKTVFVLEGCVARSCHLWFGPLEIGQTPQPTWPGRSIIGRPAYDRSQHKFLDFISICIF